MIIQKKNLTLLLFCCIFSLNLFGQSTGYIRGKVLDSLTKEPISFSTILLKQNNLGISANEEGDFIFKINSIFQSDTLMISNIGYVRKLINFKELSIEKVNYIYLNPAVIQLNEVELIALGKKKNSKKLKINSKELIKRAIENISKNYPVKPFTYVSYYRDYLKKDKDYINLNEAIVQTIDYGFNEDHTLNNFRLLDYKKNLNFLRKDLPLQYDTIMGPNYANPNKFIPNATLSNQGGNELFILMAHDAIRNFKTNSFSFIYKFSKDFLANHDFSKINPVYNNDLLLYKIKFHTKKEVNAGSIIAFGEIFIQPNDYSIHKLDYTCFDRNNQQNIFNIILEYGYSKDSLMHLKYISFNNLFSIIDLTDTTYFRVLKTIKYDTYIKLKMSNIVDPKSVRKKSYYNFMVGDKKLKVKRIVVKDSTIIVNFNNSKLEPYKATINGNSFKDINGNMLNQKKIIDYYQYRELFVQEYNQKLQFKDSCYIGNKPLFSNCISKFNGNNKYWMNTPVGIKHDIK